MGEEPTSEPTPLHAFTPLSYSPPDVNEWLALHIEALSQGSPPEPPGGALNAGSPGYYKVTFVLCIPGKQVLRQAFNLGAALQSGESLLIVDLPDMADKEMVLKSPLNPNEPEIRFTVNDKRELASASLRVYAGNTGSAYKSAYDALFKALSWLSYTHDVAVGISGCQVLEESSGTAVWLFGFVGKRRTFHYPSGDEILLSIPDYQPIFAAYREALSSLDEFHKFLSLFRCIEGIDNIRKRRERRYKREGKTIPTPAEVIPSDIEAIKQFTSTDISAFTQYLGKSFEDLRRLFKEPLRDAMAHIFPGEGVLSADRMDDIMRCESALPVVRYLARVMLKHEAEVARAEAQLGVPRLRLSYAFLGTDATLNASGGLNVQSAGLDELTVPSFPASSGPIVLLVGVEGTANEAGVQHSMKIEVVTPYGVNADVTQDLPFVLQRDPTDSVRARPFKRAMHWDDVIFQAPGYYQFRILIDDDELAVVSLNVRLSQQAI